MKKSVGAVFVCEGEILFIRRQEKLRDFPGYTSFPGGKVDSGESEEQALLREVREEVGVDLDQLREQGVVEKVELLGKTLSPSFNPVRFETHFFKVVLREKPQFKPDSSEIADIRWGSPADALSLYRTGNMLLVVPTLRIFEGLEKNIQEECLEGLDYEWDETKEVPAVEFVSGVLQLMPLSPTLPPADRTNVFLIGDGAHPILVDPSPLDAKEYDKLKRTLLRILGERRVRQIFLTHHHQDHHHLAPRLARELGADCIISEDSHHRIMEKWGKDYFDGITCRYVVKGDVPIQWQGEDVVVHEVPGHDRGQLALIPQSKSWALVGDLIQTIGTVVIAFPEGDMGEYFQSLERMIALKPKVIFPSHGIPLGGVGKLVETLKHRKMREEEISRLLGEKWSEQEIFDKIYSSLPSPLHTVAWATLRSHIRKLI